MVDDDYAADRDYTVEEASVAIANVFKDQGWTWGWTKSPTPEEVKDFIEYLIRSRGKSDWISSGRLNVRYDDEMDQDIVSVEFYLK